RACEVDDFFADVPYQGAIVRARARDGGLWLHQGGTSFVTLPAPVSGFGKEQISPTRDTRLRWMQSVIHCTHYVTGAGEQAYLRPEDAPEIAYVRREDIERSDEASTEVPGCPAARRSARSLRWRRTRSAWASPATHRSAAVACWPPRSARTWPRAGTTCTSSPTSARSACPRTHRACTSIPLRSTTT